MNDPRNPPEPPVRPNPGGLPRPQPLPMELNALPQLSMGGWAAAHAHLRSFEVIERVNTPAFCNLTVGDPSLLSSGQPLAESPLEFGQTILITHSAMGGASAGGSVPPLFRGCVYGMGSRQGTGAPPVLEAQGCDRLQELAMARRSRSFQELTVADVMRQTAMDHGLRADVWLEGATHDTLAQLNQSDLDFLRSLSRECDAEFWVDHETLYARTRLERPGLEVSLQMGDGVHEWRAFAGLQGQRQALVVSRWDVPSKAGASHVAGVPDLASETDSLTTASTVLQGLGIPRIAPDERIVHLGATSAEAGSESAGARFAALSRGFVTVVATVNGDFRIRVGTRTDLSGMGARFDGRYRVVAVRHVFDLQSGYRTEFEANRTGVGT
jgi:uncharacterized protein